MADAIIKDALLEQYKSSCAMLRDAVEKVTSDKWHKGTGEWHFSLTAYHVVETMRFYNGSDPEEMKWGERAGFSWNKDMVIENDVLPLITKELVLEFLGEVESELSSRLSGLSLQDLVEKDGFHWFTCVFEKYMYLLRHNMHHIGEMVRTLREWGQGPAKWR